MPPLAHSLICNLCSYFPFFMVVLPFHHYISMPKTYIGCLDTSYQLPVHNQKTMSTAQTGDSTNSREKKAVPRT